ncbi:Ribosomal RNA small subunit methyltransferase I [Andreprevotia sp. IGB-42]|uniref:16S rRNA (cytidine(1402)-2'-O)-methyltransferase n=1 Tax=Andreprevotia sp. IGB-42 TaxID=2497473 RepID=UPI00135BA5C2|nr:16S rRNA (cytidine(1402)-2'-O)-methyltransferase [Andreprevotia sp. IGB-42]KAF0812888.1 Ribosomal RNA small subunit methyltransferase I [Andreprevotia sp. IGB-42]
MHTDPYIPAKSTLYVVATPIGNLRDLTPRALDILAAADVIAAEDTRVTGLLLKHFGISKPMVSLREHNEHAMAEKLVARLQAGEIIAQVSDAGTPGISDPGAQLAAAAHAAGITVVPVPGASALTTALSASGFVCAHSLFYGFLPPKTKQRRDALAELAVLPYLVVIYEAPHRIVECLADIRDVFGATRQIALARELTKTFETIRRGTLDEIVAFVAADSNQQRGEFVLVLDAAPPAPLDEADEHDKVLAPLVAELPVKQAVALAQAITGAPRNALYERALTLKNAAQDD